MNTVTFYNTIVGSAEKSLGKAKVYGELKVKTLHLYSIIGTLQTDFKDDLTTEDYNNLEFMLRALQNSNPDICQYKGVPTVNPTPGAPLDPTNIAPVVGDTSVTYNADFYTFKASDFTDTFTDANGDLPNIVFLKTLPSDGDLRWNGTLLESAFAFSVEQAYYLTYTRTTDTEPTDLFQFQVSDDNTNTLFSNMASMTINIEAVVNQPPSQVGVNDQALASQDTYVFTLADFTTGTTPIYIDPEGDDAEAIKITALPGTGILYLNAAQVTVNQIISVTDIVGGSFSYTASQTEEGIHADVFNFSVSDVGSHAFTAGGIFTMNMAAYINQSASIGDGELTVDEGDITTFTRVDFTSNTVPPYSDPEGDVAWKLKITVLPLTGVIKLNNVAISANDEILFSDIDLGLLTYTQAASAGGTIPDFTFGIADEGSMIFTF